MAGYGSASVNISGCILPTSQDCVRKSRSQGGENEQHKIFYLYRMQMSLFVLLLSNWQFNVFIYAQTQQIYFFYYDLKQNFHRRTKTA